MIQKLKSPKERELEYKKWLESLPDDERKQNVEDDKLMEERDKQRIAAEEEYKRKEKEFSKIIIRNAVEQEICFESSSSLELPEEAQILLPYSFYECRNIQAAYVHENIRVCTKETFHETDDILLTNPVYKKENGLMINTHLGILLYADNDIEEVIVPEGVVEIAPYAFSGCNMKSIRLPDSLTKIGEYCFNSCPNLESITIPGKVKEIKRNCFNKCDKLKEIKLPEELEIIGPYSMCSDNLEICILPASLKKIGDRAFFNCHKLRQVDYKDSIELGYEVFVACELLEGKVPPVKHYYD
ncbi:leucine-rich repeat domain-containing protein [Treponema sp.]|uniref:leucine-rich repeat domain-containing protein n=1 Tax=Treponema sp. TaxID=166 RepID=UPI00388FCD78